MDKDQNELNGGGVAIQSKENWKQAFASNAAGDLMMKTITPEMEDTEALKTMRAKFSFFAPTTLLYAVFYAFCMFKNDAGIAYLLFIIATIVYMKMSLTRLDMKLKKGSAFYFAAMVLLAVSTFCTDDSRIIIFNKLGIFLLAMSLMLRTFYRTDAWGLGKYLKNIVCLVFGSLAELVRPFDDAENYLKTDGKKNKNIGYVLLGALISVPLLLVVISLLSEADVFFEQMTNRFLGLFEMESIAWIISRIAIVFFATYLIVARLCRHSLSEKVTDRRTGEPVLAITVTAMLTVVYLLFSGIQIFGLFLGQLQLPQGYTYAEYAREGFFQLLAVSILNLILVLVGMSFFRESKGLKGVLTVMSLCTFVMIASSAMRMIMYISCYDLTFLRILVLWTLGLLTMLFIGVLISIFSRQFKLFRYSIIVVTLLYLGLSFSHPDYIVAYVNVQKETVDYRYLEKLSADAAPVLVPYIRTRDTVSVTQDAYGERKFVSITNDQFRKAPNNFGLKYMESINEKAQALGIRTFNVSRFMAAQARDEWIRMVFPPKTVQ